MRIPKIQIKEISTRGFTLAELLVTMSVFTLLSVVVLVNFRKVDNSLVLQNVAHQVALVIRKAQISGISVAGFGSGASEIFPSYGVNFNTASPTTFTLFADRNGNNVFDGTCPGVTCERVQGYTLLKGYTIKSLLGNLKTSSPGVAVNPLNITFTRPNPDACFKRTAVGLLCPSGSLYSDADIIIQSISGATKTITIWRTGQISIQ